MNLLSTSSWFSSIAPPSVKTAEADVRVRIKNDVWIGDGAIIMSGVTIGNGAVIGAGAVVTKDVPDYAVMIGVPARLLRYRFSAEIMHRLLALKWWELDDQLLKKHQLNNIQASLEYLESLPEEARTAKNLALQRI
jgi:tetrahydrodipicolinate N-succinyltransferase